MAIVIAKLETGAVKITTDSLAPKYYLGLTDVVIQIPNPTTISVSSSKGSITLPYASIGTINGNTKPVTIALTAELLATDIFNTIIPAP